MMTLEYFYKTGENYRYIDYGDGPEREWDGDEGYDFKFKVDNEQIKKALVYILTGDAHYQIKNYARNAGSITDGYKNLLSRKLTEEEKLIAKYIITDMLDKLEELDQLEEFAEYYREDIADYYEDDAMETQEY